MSNEDGYFTHWMWRDDRGHFIPSTSVVQEDVRDDSCYYGVRSTTSGECKKCGPVTEPRYIPTRWVAA